MTQTVQRLPEPGFWPAPEVLVLRGRVIRPEVRAEELSRFGEAVWELQPAQPDAHQGVWAVHWGKFPSALVIAFKTATLAVLDHPVPSTHALRVQRELKSLQSVAQHVRLWRVFAEWMDSRGLVALDQVNDPHLDAYRSHVLAAECPPKRKRELLGSVILLHAYRDLLPGPCRMATADPWCGARGDALVAVPPAGRTNHTPRIDPATMETLLSWSLRMLEDVGPDISEARRIWGLLQAGAHPSQAGLVGLPIRGRLARFLATAGTHATLPGRRSADGQLVVDETALCRLMGLGPPYRRLSSAAQRRMIAASGLAITDGYTLDVPITGRVDGRPWREASITSEELPHLVRVLTGALFVVVCYLSGMRPGEALNLRRGCRATDPDTGELLLLGRRGKGIGRTPHRGASSRDEQTRTWVVVQPVHDAVALLEQLTPHPLLFPPRYDSVPPDSAVRSRSSHYIARDIQSFVDWVNHTFVPADGNLPIPADPTKNLHASRFRRTLAYFIVRRPRGLVAAALQYGHLATKVTLSYAGNAESAWMDDVAVERLEFTVEQIGHDQELLDDGEHVSGPAAAEYRSRIERAAPFAGRVVTGVRNTERLWARADPAIHHGQGMTCVWTKETALCRQANLALGLPDADTPDETECRSGCTNLSYTDRDIDFLRQQLPTLEARVADVLSPQPLRDRAAAQATAMHALVERHDQSRPHPTDTVSEA